MLPGTGAEFEAAIVGTDPSVGVACKRTSPVAASRLACSPVGGGKLVMLEVDIDRAGLPGTLAGRANVDEDGEAGKLADAAGFTITAGCVLTGVGAGVVLVEEAAVLTG